MDPRIPRPRRPLGPDALADAARGERALADVFTVELAELRSRARVALEGGRLDAARAALEALLTIGDDHPTTSMLTATYLIAIGQEREAAGILDALVGAAEARGHTAIATSCRSWRAELERARV